MKLVGWWCTPEPQRPPLRRHLFHWPYLSPRSCHGRVPERGYSLLVTFLLHAMVTALILTVGFEYLRPFNYPRTLLIAPALYFFTEALGSFAQLLYHGSGVRTFPIHHRPLESPSLSEFWGRRWNLWVQDWLKDMSRGVGRRQRRQRVVFTFLVSGLFHELMVNFPHWLLTGESYFGTMLGYFLIQAAALTIDKKVLKPWAPALRRPFMLLAVLLPSPLFINVPLLGFFGMTNPLD